MTELIGQGPWRCTICFAQGYFVTVDGATSLDHMLELAVPIRDKRAESELNAKLKRDKENEERRSRGEEEKETLVLREWLEQPRLLQAIESISTKPQKQKKQKKNSGA